MRQLWLTLPRNVQQRRIASEVKVIVPELMGQHHQALGMVSKRILPGHTNAAMKLDRLLGNRRPSRTLLAISAGSSLVRKDLTSSRKACSSGVK